MAAGLSRLFVMSVGLVKRPIPSALLSEPSTTAAPNTSMLPETSARPVSMTMRVFRTTPWWDPRPTLANSTLDNVAGERRRANLRWALRPHCKEGCDLTYAWGEYSGFYTLSSRSTQRRSQTSRSASTWLSFQHCRVGLTTTRSEPWLHSCWR